MHPWFPMKAGTFPSAGFNLRFYLLLLQLPVPGEISFIRKW